VEVEEWRGHKRRVPCLKSGYRHIDGALCYQNEAELYGDYSIEPLTQTLDDLRAELDGGHGLVARLGEEVRAIEGAADWAHVDVMDNHFVPNLTIGLPVVQSLRKATAIPFDVHLMITDPERWAPAYAEAGAYNVTFHAEACENPVALAKTLRAAGAKAGLAIDRDTPVEPYLELLPYVDTLLIMTIKAGFGGQSFMPEMLQKVRDVRRRVAVKNLEVRIEVDGAAAHQSFASVLADAKATHIAKIGVQVGR